MKKNQGFNNKVWVSGTTKTAEVSKLPKSMNVLLWLVCVGVVVVGVFANMYLDSLGADYSIYNTSIVVVLVLIALGVARFTNQGRSFWTFFNASKLELSKVVWPTRRETMTITAMVIVVVIIFAVLISLFGMVFEKFIQYFLG